MAVRWWSKLVGSRTRGPETEPAPEPRPGEAVVEPAEAPASPPTPDAAPTHSRWADETAFEVHAELANTVEFLKCVEPLIDHPLDVTRSRPLG